MANFSLISIPPDVEEPVVLRRFLARLVEELDIVLGNRAGPQNQYTDQEQLLDTAKTLTDALDIAKESLEFAITQVEDLSNEVVVELTARLSAIEQLNIEQDNRLDIIEQVDLDQDNRLDTIEQVDLDQDTKINDLEAAGFITDAPSDGNKYVRKDGAWEILV